MNKPKRKLSDITFEHEGAHVSLVSKTLNGGPANGVPNLLFKSLNDVTEEHVEKASQVTVTLSITEYLTKFFDLWWEDALILARVFGYDVEESDDSYDEYINKKVASVSIMKSLVLDKTKEEMFKAVAELNPNDLLAVLKDQEVFESGLKSISDKSSIEKAQLESSDEGDLNLSPSEEKIVTKEFITKEAMEAATKEAVEKATAPLREELEAAQNQIKTYQEEKQKAIMKSRKEKVVAIKGEEGADDFIKATEALDEEAFATVLKALKITAEAEANSDMFVEKGVSGEADEEVEEDVFKELKERITKQYK